jgi:hypothetical protein
MADTNELVRDLNGAIREKRLTASLTTGVAGGHGASRAHTATVTTTTGEVIGIGDQVATRRNDRELKVSNRDRWTVVAVCSDGSLVTSGRSGDRTLPAEYVREHVELAFATTVHGAQGETAPNAHLLIGDTTGAAAAYVGMTRGRHRNTAHLVADSLAEARAKWIDVFSRDRSDLGPTHAATAARDAVDRFGAAAATLQRAALGRDRVERPQQGPPPREHRHPDRDRSGIGR